MHHFRQLCAALVLTLALSLSAFGGDIWTPGDVPPPPPPPDQSSVSIPTDTTNSSQSTASSNTTATIIETALDILDSALVIY